MLSKPVGESSKSKKSEVTFPEEILNRNTSLFWVLAVSKEMK